MVSGRSISTLLSHSRHRGAWLVVAALFLNLVNSPSLSAQGFDAVITDKSVPKGESTVIQVRYQNCQPESPPTAPEVEGLVFEAMAPQSTQNLTVSNGRRVALSTIIYPFQVTPQEEGTFIIPPFESRIQGKSYKTRSINLQATKERDYSQYAFIRVRLPKQEVYLGEVFQLAVDLYERNAKLEERPTLPSDGLVVDEVGNIRQGQTRVGNTIYNRVTIQYLARAVKTGELTIGPVTWKVPLLFQNRSNRRQRSPLDSFMRGFVDLNSTIRREVTLNSEPTTLNVLPLPEENRPEGFGGAVGTYTMTSTASPTTLTVGDPITISMRITGRGALEALQMPNFDHWREFKQYPETSALEYDDEMRLTGYKTFEKVVIPNNAEITEVPEIRFSFFDPLEKSYKTLTQAPTPLAVTPNTQAVSQPTIIAGQTSTERPLNIATNIVHIKPRLGTPMVATTPWLQRPSFIWFNLIPIAAWLTAWGIQIQRTRSDRNPRAKRRKQVQAQVASGIGEMRQLAQANQSDAFFALLFRLLQEQIGERIQQPASAITEAVIDAQLKNAFAEPSDLASLERLFHACNQSRYAPVESTEELNQLTEEAAQILTALQNLPDDLAS